MWCRKPRLPVSFGGENHSGSPPELTELLSTLRFPLLPSGPLTSGRGSGPKIIWSGHQAKNFCYHSLALGQRRVTVFDIVFAEPESVPGSRVSCVSGPAFSSDTGVLFYL